MGKEQKLSPEELQAKVDELQSALNAETAAKAKLQETLNEVSKGQGEVATNLAEALAKLEAAEKENASLSAENESLKAVNDELTNELEKASEKTLQEVVNEAQKKETKLSTETFTVEGKKYGFNYPVMILGGKRITNEDVLASDELQVQLVAAKHSMLKAL